jgi:hypothetical protein
MITTVGEPERSDARARRSERSAAHLAFRLLLALCLGSLIATGVLAYRHWAYQQRVTGSSRALLASLTAKAAASPQGDAAAGRLRRIRSPAGRTHACRSAWADAFNDRRLMIA